MSRELEARVGSTADKWLIEALVGVGGMAAVYRAKHVRNGRRVALKVLHADVKQPAVVARFLREGYVANQIRHPAVVPVLDDGTLQDGCPYLVMEFLEGHALDAHIAPRPSTKAAKPPLTEAEAADVLRVLIDVLAAAEPLHLIHRDIKPANIFRVSDGSLRLLDFGIAILDDDRGTDTAHTAPGVSIGSPAYMPPEQARARRELVGPHSDRYAAAATAYALLTGRPPRYAATHAEAFALAIVRPLPSVLTQVSVSPAFAAVIDRALSFDIEKRFPSAAAMAAALNDAVPNPRGTYHPAQLSLADASIPPADARTGTAQGTVGSSRRGAKLAIAALLVTLTGAAAVTGLHARGAARGGPPSNDGCDASSTTVDRLTPAALSDGGAVDTSATVVPSATAEPSARAFDAGAAPLRPGPRALPASTSTSKTKPATPFDDYR